MKKEKEMVSRVYMLSIHDRVEKLEQEKKDLIQTLGRQELIKLKHEMALIEIENLVSGYEGDMAEAVIRVVQKSF